MGLVVGTPVATSLIDAHAGGLGMIGVGSKNSTDFRHRLGKSNIYDEISIENVEKKNINTYLIINIIVRQSQVHNVYYQPCTTRI